jgi:hypothetical protein
MYPLSPLPEEAEKFAGRFYSDTKHSVQHTIFKCWALVQAQSNLSKGHFDQLCRELRLSNRSPTFKRLILIGNNGARLLRIAESLPDDQAILCRLAILEDQVLQELTLTRCIRPAMTLSELKKALVNYRAQHQPLPTEEEKAPV